MLILVQMVENTNQVSVMYMQVKLIKQQKLKLMEKNIVQMVEH